MSLCDLNCVIIWANIAGCALYGKFQDILYEESMESTEKCATIFLKILKHIFVDTNTDHFTPFALRMQGKDIDDTELKLHSLQEAQYFYYIIYH